MKVLGTFLVVAVVLIVLALAVPVLRDTIFPSTDAAAAAPDCPKGQEEKLGCKWVQQIQSGKCGWLPSQAVGNGHREVPKETCPSVTIPTKGYVKPPEPPSPLVTPALKRTLTPVPGEPVEPGTPFLDPTACTPTPGVLCDTCKQLERNADAEERQADALETIAVELGK